MIIYSDKSGKTTRLFIPESDVNDKNFGVLIEIKNELNLFTSKKILVSEVKYIDWQPEEKYTFPSSVFSEFLRTLPRNLGLASFLGASIDVYGKGEQNKLLFFNKSLRQFSFDGISNYSFGFAGNKINNFRIGIGAPLIWNTSTGALSTAIGNQLFSDSQEKTSK